MEELKHFQQGANLNIKMKTMEEMNDQSAWKKQILSFLFFLVLAFGFFFLHKRGIELWEISSGKSLSRYLAVVFFMIVGYFFFASLVQLFVRQRRGPQGETKMLTGFLKAVVILAIILAFIESTGRLTALGAVAAGFVGLLLGWSLQAPVSGIAAWAMITLRRPFRIGDRVQFPSLGLVGDITDIGIMYTVLNQVGGTVGSEEATNRYILVPNAMLFSQVAINYTSQQEAAYFLDEVVMRITYDSDWEEAENILLRAAEKVTPEIIKITGQKPYIRSDMYDYGIFLRLRYMTAATDRPRIAHEINKLIFWEFQNNCKVDFAIPFIYSYRSGEKDKREDAGKAP